MKNMLNKLNRIDSVELYLIINPYKDYHVYETPTYFSKPFVPKNSHKRTNKRK